MGTRILIDGSNAAHRFRHTYSELSVDLKDGSELRTGVVYGFFKLLLECMDTYSPDAIVVAWDGKDYWRKDAYPNYKGARRAKRAEYSEEEVEAYSLFHQVDMPNAKSMLLSVGVPSLHLDRFEADDVIGSLVRASKRATTDQEVVIISTDADFIQLVCSSVRVYNPMTHVLTYYDQQEQGIVQGVSRIAPTGKTYLLRRAITGDTSDSISGVHGVGKVSVVTLVNQEWKPDESYASYRERMRPLWEKSVRGRRILESEHVILKNLILMDLQFQHGAVGIPKDIDLHSRVADKLNTQIRYIDQCYKGEINGKLIVDKKIRADPSPFLWYFRDTVKFKFASNPTSAADVKDKFQQQLLRMVSTL